MLKELVTTTLLSLSVGGPLMAIPDSSYTNWERLTIDDEQQHGNIIYFMNDGRGHTTGTTSTNFDEICYYVANTYHAELQRAPQNYGPNTYLQGFIYQDFSGGYKYLVLNARLDAIYFSEDILDTWTLVDAYTKENQTFSSLPADSDYLDDVSSYADGSSAYINLDSYIEPGSKYIYIRGEDYTFHTTIIKFDVYSNTYWDEDWNVVVHYDNTAKMNYDRGLEIGIAEGRIIGYDTGYASGYADAKVQYDTNDSGVFGIITSAFSAVGSFFSFEIAPNLTVGMLFSIPIVVGIVFVVIKFVKG